MAIQPIRLDRFSRGVRIVDENGVPTLQEQAREQRNLEAIENSVNAVIDAQNAADTANAAAEAADLAAAAANTAATTAQSSATAASAASALATSGTSGLTITATDAGADVTISISAHTRVYGDGTSVSVSSGSVTGLAYSTIYYIYYDQASRLGGAVTYVATTSQTTAAQTADRHSLGTVTTPASGFPANSGKYNLPPGVVEP
jgi:hypothetical protein